MNKTVLIATCPKCRAPIPTDAPQGLCPKCVLQGVAQATEAGVLPTATAEIPSLERLAMAFPHLEIFELIGRGGMGFVFKARQPHLDRLVALKLLPDRLATNPEFTERFNREGKVLARLNHPNIVSVYDFGHTGGFYYLLMELVDGVNLRQAMQAGRFSPSEALALVPKVCEALQYAHEQGILHRDIKPENILLDAKGQVKIADFGIAKLLGEEAGNLTLTNTGAALGTPHYMAPEQLEKPGTVDHRADLYSLGVVFYEMLTGELPIGRFAAPSAKTPMHANVDDVVFRTLAKDRELRFQSANEMKAGVEQLGSGGVEGSAARGRELEEVKLSTKYVPMGRVYPLSIVAGVALVGMSLFGPLSAGVAVLWGHGGQGIDDFWEALSVVAMPAVGGTLFGWLGLTRLRQSSAPQRGLALALFASLTWPFLALIALSTWLPMLVFGPRGSVDQNIAGRLLVILLPVAAIGFGSWLMRALVRWVRQNPDPQENPWVRWVVVILILGTMGMILVLEPGRRPQESLKLAPTTDHAAPPWVPEIPPGGKPDLDGIRQEAANLTGQKRYEQALQRVLWYHQHALEFEPAQVGVRLSFALAQWEELARHYPAAKAALIDTRDRATLEFQNGGGYFGLFQEVAALNKVLRDFEATYSLFKSIHARDPGLARQCYPVVEEQLIERREYALCLKYIPDAEQRFENARQSWQQRGNVLPKLTPQRKRSRQQELIDSEFVLTCRRLIEILVGTGHQEQAKQIQEQALEVLDTEELQSALKDAELKVRTP